MPTQKNDALNDNRSNELPGFDTATSATLYRRARNSLALGVSSGMRRLPPAPLYFERGEGAWFFDVDGHRLLDYTLGWGPLILGNGHPAIMEAVTAQLARGYSYGAQHVGEIELAELMVQSVPGVERVIFSNTGTEAVQAALRLARAHTGRNEFIKFEGHYHGWQNNVLVSYRHTPIDPSLPVAACGGQPPSEYADTYVLPWNDARALETMFRERGEKIAAAITEPLLANSGCCEPLPGYLERIVALCRQYGAVSIFDEVITGFRLALGGARQFYGVQPDLSVYAKALAGGFTLSAVGGSSEVFQTLESGKTIHAGTYNGSPISVAAGIATLKTLAAPGALERILKHGQRLQAAIHEAAARCGVILSICGAGSVFGVHFGLAAPPRDYRQYLHADNEQYGAFRLALLRQGVQVLPDGRWYVGAAHGEEELHFAVSAIHRAMEVVAQ